MKEEKEDSVAVDTPRCYNPNMNDEKLVHIPGATHLLVEFDNDSILIEGQNGKEAARESKGRKKCKAGVSGRRNDSKS